jgi:hypothetical protein
MARWSSYQSSGSRNPFRIQKKSLVAIFQLFFEEISIGKECRPTVFAFVGNLHTSQHYLYQHLMIMNENDKKAHVSAAILPYYLFEFVNTLADQILPLYYLYRPIKHPLG